MDNIDGTLLLAFYARLLLLTFLCSYCYYFFVLIVYTFLFTFMLAYCVNHLSSLKARLVSEHFGGNKIKIYKRGHMIELWQTFQRQVQCSGSVAGCIYHERRV